MKTSVKAYLAVGAAALLASAGGSATAHNSVGSAKAGELRTLTERADLVVLGTVADVRYINALDRETGAAVPHVFVTYRVEKTVRGQTRSETLTLRFIGGPDGQGRFLAVSGVPKFQPGERDVLFVVGSGEEGCALADCEWGRFRVLGDRVYNTHGSPVRALIKDNAVARGLPPSEFRSFAFPAPTFDGLMQNPEVRKRLEAANLDLEDARKRFEAEAPKTLRLAAGFSSDRSETGESDAGGQPRPVRPVRPGRPAVRPDVAAAVPGVVAPRPELFAVAPPSREKPVLSEAPVSLDQFLSNLERLAREAKRAPRPVADADPKREIKLSPFRAVAPRAEPRVAEAVAARTDADAAEEAALRANDFNPVLPR